MCVYRCDLCRGVRDLWGKGDIDSLRSLLCVGVCSVRLCSVALCVCPGELRWGADAGCMPDLLFCHFIFWAATRHTLSCRKM